MSCGKCPEFKEKFKESKFKDRTKPQEAKAPEPEPIKEKKKPWWEKLKDRIDPAGIGGLPSPSMGFSLSLERNTSNLF